MLSCVGSIFSDEPLFKVVAAVQITLEFTHVVLSALILAVDCFAFLNLWAKLLNVLNN